MATITLDYDGRNKAARSVIEMLRNLDFFTVSEAAPKRRRKSGIVDSTTKCNAVVQR